MGSKSDIIPHLMRLIPKSENFVDLFGGGFAVTHAAILHNKAKHFHFNEIEPTTVDLIHKAIRGEFSYERFKPEWISREEFFKTKDCDAYVRVCWSFGNNQTAYLFSKDIEAYKRSLHNAVVFDVFDDTAKAALGISAWPFAVKSIAKKRLIVRYLVNKLNPRMRPTRPQHLERLQQLRQLQQLQHLERLQQLERLQHLPITWSSVDYREVKIPENSIVYCDPPYENTGAYTRDFNHTEFWNWARNLKYPLFVSEYTIPHDFRLIGKFQRNTKLSPKGETKTKPEILACNEIAYERFFKK